MKRFRPRRAVVLLIPAILIGVLAWGVFTLVLPRNSQETPGASGLSIPLAMASEQPQEQQEVLSRVAGLGVYTKVDATPDLSKSAVVFQAFVDAGTNYIIGEISVPRYEKFSSAFLSTLSTIHVYMDTSGNIVAFIPKDSPLDLMQWNPAGGTTISRTTLSTITTTTLEDALLRVVNAGGYTSYSPLTYSHWQYPDATQLTLAAALTSRVSDRPGRIDIFVPQNVTLYEVAYSYWMASGLGGSFELNDKIVESVTGVIKAVGLDTTTEFTPGQLHRISIERGTADGADVAIVIISRQ